MKDTRKPRTYKVLGTLEKEEYQDSHERQVFGTLAIAQKSRFSYRQSGSHLVKQRQVSLTKSLAIFSQGHSLFREKYGINKFEL